MATQPNSAKRLIPFAIILVLVGALGYINKSLSHSAQKTNEEGGSDSDPEAEKAKKEAAAKPAAQNAIKTDLEPEITINNPAQAKMKITLGWQYDANTQVHPENLNQIVQTIKQIASGSNGTISAEIVDLDVPTEELSPAAQSVPGLGLTINGVSTLPVNGQTLDLSNNPGQGVVTQANIQAAITAASAPK